LVSLAQQLSLAAQAANKIEDFKQPSLVKNQSTYLFFVLRIQTKENPFEGTKEVCEAFIPCKNQRIEKILCALVFNQRKDTNLGVCKEKKQTSR